MDLTTMLIQLKDQLAAQLAEKRKEQSTYDRLQGKINSDMARLTAEVARLQGYIAQEQAPGGPGPAGGPNA